MKIQVERTERGWAGHFCCASDCMFRRNTLLQCGRKRIVVSTVGGYMPSVLHPEEIRKVDTIGHNRYYETMAFRGHRDGVYVEAVIEQPISFVSPWSIDHHNEESDSEANDMHERAVAELMTILQADCDRRNAEKGEGE